ncbi:hypothetical protein [Actinomadura sp. WAC 06369]|uniref:hypothetical protein n=1 Tax=Actinomadura sp. WAC 06369 TaxID=2203193 RepID=UPI001003FB7B|nr:hypothetical protein [Actinomadura sp. WAC 06369]RSN60027.1 hypothetical protein DMH08_21765 [Actinomadura sp. WAC 06369]
MRPRADRWADASAGRSPRGRWAERRLFAAARRRDPEVRKAVARVAGTPGHRLRERALGTVAAWWAETRDPLLRECAVRLGAVAAEPPARAVTLALAGRLAADLAPGEAGAVPGLLADPDPDVRARAEAFCAEASGAMLRALWALGPDPDSPLEAVLLANGEPPTSGPLDRLWERWLDRPDARVWAALSRWGRPAVGGPRARLTAVAVAAEPDVLREPRNRAALIDALALGDHPLCAIAEEKVAALRDQTLVDELCDRALDDGDLRTICAKHGFAPKDPMRRVVFFLLTGRPEQHRAMDPDGSLLSLAYASATDSVRERMRTAMLAAGDLDLVRVIVGDDRRARVESMSPGEVAYLAEQLAGRGAWDDLWSIVQDLPIATGVSLVRLFGEWAPRGDDDRRVFELYRATAPDALARAVEHLEGLRDRVTRQARYLFRGRVNDVSFAPDGPFLAAAGTNRVAGVFDLRTASLAERYDGFGASVGRVLHVGGGALVAAERTNRVDRPCRLLRCAGGEARALHAAPGSVTCLARAGDGGFVAGTRAGSLLVGAPGGSVESRPVAALGLGGGAWARSVAVHPGSGRIAVAARRLAVTAPGGGPAAAVTPPGPAVAWTSFADADTLVCAGRGGAVRRLRLCGDAFEETAQVGLDVHGLVGMVGLPRTGEVVVADDGGGLHVLDAGTLERTAVHRAADVQNRTGMTVSPGGDFLAVGNADGSTDLFDLRVHEVPRIVGRPVASLVPGHLAAVGSAMADGPVRRGGGVALRLLEACLEHRFRFDVELGDAVRLSAGEFDISL